MSRRRARAHAPFAVGLALLVGGVAGCGGGDDGGPDGPSSAATPAATSTTASPGPSTPADPSAYLPVPEGVELTEPGTELSLGESALVAWQPRQDLVGVVGVRVDTIERTSVRRSLSTFTLDAAARASTPYFVTMTIGNGGDTDLGGRQPPVYVVDSAGRLVPPTGVDQDFAACPGSLLPAVFAPGERARSCLIFLVPQGATLTSVTFRPPEGVVPITWAGRVRTLGAREPSPSPSPTTSPTTSPTASPSPAG